MTTATTNCEQSSPVMQPVPAEGPHALLRSGEVLVYRFQCPTGSGCYTSGAYSAWRNYVGFSDDLLARHPGPYDDGLAGWGVGLDTKRWLFGFATKRQLDNWFPVPAARMAMFTFNGTRPYVFAGPNAPTSIQHGRSQCVFKQDDFRVLGHCAPDTLEWLGPTGL